MKARAKMDFPLTIAAARRVYRTDRFVLFSMSTIESWVVALREGGANPEILSASFDVVTVEFDMEFADQLKLQVAESAVSLVSEAERSG